MTDTTSEPGTELATFDPTSSAYPVLFAQDGEGGVTQIIADNFGDTGFSIADLDRVTVPSGGGLAWTIPDEEPARYIEGVVIHKQPTRAFWFKKRGEDGEEDGPPDCLSPDGLVGLGAFGPGSESNTTGECSTCPMNVFGSSTTGSGNGKACKEQLQLFMLQPGALLPIQVSLPPTSLKGWRKYMTRMATRGKSYFAVITRLGLEVTKGGGQTYSVVTPGTNGELAPAEAAAARQYGATIKNFLDASARDRDAAAAQRLVAGAPDAAPAASDGAGDATGDLWSSVPPADAAPAEPSKKKG